MPRLVIVPRWGGDPTSDFYPWLRREVAATFDDTATAPLLPTPDAPQIAPSVAHLADLLGDDPTESWVLARSVGCQVAMRTLERLDGPRVAGCLFVAGWFMLAGPAE